MGKTFSPPELSSIALAWFLVDVRPGLARFSPLRSFLPLRFLFFFCGRLVTTVSSVGVPALAEAAADAATPCADEGRAAAVATKEVGEEVDEEIAEGCQGGR